MRNLNKKHGQTATPTWNSWYAMQRRCHEIANPAYERYGGRGITVCDRWRDSFEAFLTDMGERPLGKTLDRIDPDGNYEPGNCRWATPLEQRHNRSQPHGASEEEGWTHRCGPCPAHRAGGER